MPTLGDFFDTLDVWIKDSNIQLVKDFFEDWLHNTQGPMWRKSRKLELKNSDAIELVRWFVEEVKESFIDNPQNANISTKEKIEFAEAGVKLLTKVEELTEKFFPSQPTTINSPPVSKQVM